MRKRKPYCIPAAPDWMRISRRFAACRGKELVEGSCHWRWAYQQWAIGVVATAKRRGLLPDPKTLPCTDCGKRAHGYDHRDYRYPLQVEAVCRSCNWYRGPEDNPVGALRNPEHRYGQPQHFSR